MTDSWLSLFKYNRFLVGENLSGSKLKLRVWPMSKKKILWLSFLHLQPAYNSLSKQELFCRILLSTTKFSPVKGTLDCFGGLVKNRCLFNILRSLGYSHSYQLSNPHQPCTKNDSSTRLLRPSWWKIFCYWNE